VDLPLDYSEGKNRKGRKGRNTESPLTEEKRETTVSKTCALIFYLNWGGKSIRGNN